MLRGFGRRTYNWRRERDAERAAGKRASARRKERRPRRHRGRRHRGDDAGDDDEAGVDRRRRRSSNNNSSSSSNSGGGDVSPRQRLQVAAAAPSVPAPRAQVPFHTTFRRPFLAAPSLEGHHAARAVGSLPGDFQYVGTAVFAEGDQLLPHGAEGGTQHGPYGGVAYMGGWSLGRRHGQGTSFRVNGSTEFDGEWRLDFFRKGSFYLPSGRLEYTGEFNASGQLHGRGTFYFSDGSSYHGEFQAGNFHGNGRREMAHGELIVEGTFAHGRILHGRTAGTLELPPLPTTTRRRLPPRHPDPTNQAVDASRRPLRRTSTTDNADAASGPESETSSLAGIISDDVGTGEDQAGAVDAATAAGVRIPKLAVEDAAQAARNAEEREVGVVGGSGKSADEGDSTPPVSTGGTSSGGFSSSSSTAAQDEDEFGTDEDDSTNLGASALLRAVSEGNDDSLVKQGSSNATKALLNAMGAAGAATSSGEDEEAKEEEDSGGDEEEKEDETPVWNGKWRCRLGADCKNMHGMHRREQAHPGDAYWDEAKDKPPLVECSQCHKMNEPGLLFCMGCRAPMAVDKLPEDERIAEEDGGRDEEEKDDQGERADEIVETGLRPASPQQQAAQALVASAISNAVEVAEDKAAGRPASPQLQAARVLVHSAISAASASATTFATVERELAFGDEEQRWIDGESEDGLTGSDFNR